MESFMTDEASIIHVNVTDFFASLAVAQDSSLRKEAFVIAPDTYGSCAIINTSEGARKEGIEKGMSVSHALRMVPHLKVLLPDEKLGQAVQQELSRIAQTYTPSVEHDARGHLYLDARGTTRLFGPPRDIAVKISSRMRESLSLSPAVAIASNRLVAKIATRAIRPAGVTAISPGEERLFLRSQDITLLPGLTRSMKRVLTAAGMREIGSLADLDETQVSLLLGKKGLTIRRYALGEDIGDAGMASPDERALEARVDFARPSEHLPTIEGGLFQILEELWTGLRENGESGERIELTVFWSDRQLSTAAFSIPPTLLYDGQLIGTGRTWLNRALTRRIRVSGIHARITGMRKRRIQRDLFLLEQEEKHERFQKQVDSLRQVYGNRIITRSFALFHG